MADLAEDQWDLGGLVIGRGQAVAVDDFDLGDVGARLGDVDVAGGEGVVPGYDYHGGRTLSLTVFTDQADAATAQAAWRSLESLWRQHDLRYTPRTVVPLRIRVADRDTVRVYGRPRKFSPTGLRGLPDGAVGAIATFDAMHTNYLSDEESTVTLSLVTTGDGGITWPIASWPITWAAGGERQDAAYNAGDMDAWPLITISGPITNPQVALVGTNISIRLVDTIADGQSVTLDPRPWSRSITRSDGASLAGKARGSRLEDLRLPPGQTVIHFSGTDLTGTSSCTVRHRHAYSTP
ncbi:hypothetical protein [Nocardiopsis sp. NRRL B-16309]|uniref:hypothetical protein n=1 Tax=Nocardiopsis sp. NRRL B-16309 TaxID=1519494 RepID=UPI0006AFBE34|nr:hypothetical protein [Nocardiopsis sp. NRRL B-16309]KOX10147.1 hypothetical protein ADL05_26085 [Nocardiopsis sp. NRRL B-16309]